MYLHRSSTLSQSARTRDLKRCIDRARLGDEQAIEELCLAFEPTLLHFVERQMGRQARRWSDPRDVVQIVLGSVMGDLRGMVGEIDEEALRRRLFGVARWRICDLARRHQADLGDSHHGAADQEVAVHESTMGPVTVCDRASWVHHLIAQLEPDQREVVRLRALEGLEFAEVGERLGIEPDAARMRFRRAVDALRNKVKGRELEAG